MASENISPVMTADEVNAYLAQVYPQLNDTLAEYYAVSVGPGQCVVRLMRKAEPGPIDGHCRILKMGRSLMVFDIEMRSPPDGPVVAHATGTYSIPPRKQAFETSNEH
mgnify:CR=1 FL=1